MNLKSDQIMEMMRDIGILPWGHRHILRTTLEEMNKSLGGEDLIGTFATNETHDLIEETSDGMNDCESTPSPCDLCAGATQHTCRNCGIPVCNLMCSIQDPNSDNESHRIHKYGDARCVRKHVDEPLRLSAHIVKEVLKISLL